MPFSRSNRTDRRRRVIRETIATESDFAVESVRAKRRARRAEHDNLDDEFKTGYRDPGYSQAVRKTCQVRLVQLIPIRRGSLAAVLGVMWTAWALLLAAHYFFHVQGTSEASVGRSTIAIAALFHLRMEHSVARWMTCQLWALTAICAWLIFQLRRHKLDDYRARYRIWILLAVVAAFSSFDASSSCLYLIGQTIDPWTRKEIGYGGWPLVLATFSSFVGLIGLRLTSELKQSPASVALWFTGLIAWAISALLGSGLIRSTLSPGATDMIVGGCWLGGGLAVFQAAGMYLRQSYIHAQKRFLERSSLAAKPRQWSMPSLPWKRNQDAEFASGESPNKKRSGGTERESLENDSLSEDSPRKKRSWFSWRRSDEYDDDLEDDEVDQDDDRASRARTENNRESNGATSKGKEDSKPSRLLGIIPHRRESNEDVRDEPIREDDGGDVDEGLTKKPGWFGIGGHKNRVAEKKPATATPVKPSPKSRSNDDEDSDDDTLSIPKKKWGFTIGRKTASEPTSSTKRDQDISRKDSKPEPVKQSTARPASDSKSSDPASKRSWLSWKGKKPRSDSERSDAKDKSSRNEDRTNNTKSNDSSKSETKKVGRIMGWLDGLKLKPPTDMESKKPTQEPTSSIRSQPVSNATKPVPVSNNRPLPSTQSAARDDEEDDDVDYRNLSKAERKRLRRQQDDRRAA